MIEDIDMIDIIIIEMIEEGLIQEDQILEIIKEEMKKLKTNRFYIKSYTLK